MATYKEIQEYIKNKYGYVAKTCWIAHTKSEMGITTRMAANRKDAEKRVYPCPEDKQKDITEALKYFGMI